MITFLVVDDDSEMSSPLKARLEDEFPEAQIDVAAHYQEALRLARAIGDAGENYDVAFLDVFLPLDDNEYSEPGLHLESRKELYRALTRDTVVFNHSAHKGNVKVKQFMEELHGPNSAVGLVIPAADREFAAREMMSQAHRAVYGRRIDVELGQILAARQHLAFAARGGNGGQDVVCLMRDIRDHWSDLDDEIRRRARMVFDIQEREGEQVIVNLT